MILSKFKCRPSDFRILIAPKSIVIGFSFSCLLSPMLPAQSIALSQVEVDADRKGDVRVTASAVGTGVEVGSYSVAVVKQPGDETLPCCIRDEHGRQFVEVRNSGSDRFNFKDNGPEDASPEEGTLTLTIPTEGWPTGRYECEVIAHNRPAPGDYVMDKKTIEIEVKKDSVNGTVIEHPEINVSGFQVDKVSDHKTRLTMTAEGRGIAIGSYSIRIDRKPEGAVLPGFVEENNFIYKTEVRDGKTTPFLQDNGPTDEDPREGVFIVTLDTSTWPEGEYALLGFAQNRPAAGPYIAGQTDYFYLNIGEKQQRSVSNIPGIEHRIVFQQEGVYACFPSLVELPDGRLMVSMGTRVNRSHSNAEGGTAFRVSSDGGRTWKPTTEPMIDKKWLTKDGRYVTVDSKGWISASAAQVGQLLKEGRYLYENFRNGEHFFLGGLSARTSHDQGATWKSIPLEIEGNTTGAMGYNKAADEIVTRNNVRLLASYAPRVGTASMADIDKPPYAVQIIRSEDDGQNWSVQFMHPKLPVPDLPFNETALVETADGKVLAMMRAALSDTEDVNMWISESTDDGKTWSEPRDSGILGFPACLRRLENGDLIALYGRRHPPMGIRACISRDNGKTWDVKNEMIIRNDGLGATGDLGYPMAHILDTGEILVVYYLTTNGSNTHIASSRFRIPEFPVTDNLK